MQEPVRRHLARTRSSEKRAKEQNDRRHRADAGSDVAGIKTRAVRDGDDWVINGSKVTPRGARILAQHHHNSGAW